MTQKALRMALNFVETVHVGEWVGSIERQLEVITAIKEALAKEKTLQALHDENERLGLYKDEHMTQEIDIVNQPLHYKSHQSGVECIQITEHMNFCLGNAIKYIWRAGLKSNSEIEDLRKARWYIDREIQRLVKQNT